MGRRAKLRELGLIAAMALAVASCSDGGETTSASSNSGSGTPSGSGGSAGSGGNGGMGGAPAGSGGMGGMMAGSGGMGGMMAGSGGMGGMMAGSGGMGGVGGAPSGSGGMGGAPSGSGGMGGMMAGSGGMGGSGGMVAGSGGMGGNGGAPSGSGGGPQACSSNADCNDNIACTQESCIGGVCVQLTNHAVCDDGTYCNGFEKCDPVNGAPGTGCAASSGSPCDDGVSCTVDACNEASKSCSHAPTDALCDNKVACDGVETCNALVGCMNSQPLNCDDGIACTDDFCDLQAGGCAHVKNDAKCSNDLFCDGIESCAPGAGGNPATGCKAGTPVNCGDGIACTTDACDEATDSCKYTENNAACNDGLYCNGVEACVAGVGCQAGSPIVCNDGLACTSDACSEAQKKCVFGPNNAACDDGLYCNGQETCDPSGAAPSGCKKGTAIACPSDGISCTNDACEEASKSCKSTADNTKCPSGELCIPGTGGCTAAKPCSTDAQCDDGDLCNGKETCNVVCKPGNPVFCDDGVPCTVDSCAPQTGACVHAPNNNVCNDGFNCNGVETCNAQVGCVQGTAVNCDDGIGCTFDQCNDPVGTCSHYSQDFVCDDGLFCNGQEVCGPSGCKAGTPAVCNDGVTCTADVCDPVVDACKAVPNSNLCPCGQTCNASQGGCGNFCQVATCQGKVYACGDCIDNDGDCKPDSADGQCLGPCDNTEDSFYGGIAGQNNSPCKSDCYFDQDTGAGNDDCYWSHKCDPLSVAPNYPPEGSQCAYNPNASIAGYPGTCAQAFQTQSAACAGYCGPLTPNGCDCFGCCAIPGAPTTVWLGSENPSGVGSCNINTVNDPTKCKPCTQVAACLNTCDKCEVCIGKPLDPSCIEQTCPAGVQKCGQAGQLPCPAGYSCITGCCVINPN
jgi:hypothetical protein